MRIGDYEIWKPINSGGTANVYLAIDLHNGQPVALKKLKNGMLENPVMREKFIEEANRYLYMNHPNIVKLKDFILTEKEGYLIMEYVEGSNLKNFVEQVGGLPAQNVGLFSMEVLAALEYAHNRGVLHLDIKPANIMLSDTNEIKLIDFGISSDSKKSVKEIMGSPYYMSPEQIKGKDIDPRSDIYSFGVTVYELFTGSLPFQDSKTREELYDRIQSSEIPKVKVNFEGDSEYLSDVNEIITNCTAKNPNDRYQNCGELQLDIIKLLN
jgi:serine/threonine protein kinase